MNIHPKTTEQAGLSDLPPLIGTEIDPEESILGHVIFDRDTPNISQLRFRLQPSRHTTVGEVLGARGRRPSGEDIVTLIRVENIWEHNPHEDALSATIKDVLPMETRYAPEGRSTVIYRAASAQILEEVILDREGSVNRIEAAETLPLSGSPIVSVPPSMIANALNFSTNAMEGLTIGSIHGLPDVPVRLHRNVAQTHMLFVGGIGRGKSYGRGVVAEELYSQGVPQVNIDPMGEMVDATIALGGMNVVPGDGFSLPLSALQAGEVIDAIPAINKGTNIETLIAYAHDKLLAEHVLQSGTEFGVDDLISAIEEYAPSLEMKSATFRPATMRARSLSKIPYIGSPFNWEHELKPGQFINIDCRGLSVSDLRLIAAAVSRDLQRLAKHKKIPFTVLSIDEAHLIAPNDDKVVTTQVLREIARIGRHYRLGLIMTTQSPADMDRAIIKRLLTRFIFAIEPDQLDALRGVFSDATDGMIRQLPKLKVGTCIISGVSETVKHATVVDIRKRSTPVGGGTPDVYSDIRARGWEWKATSRTTDDMLEECQ